MRIERSEKRTSEELTARLSWNKAVGLKKQQLAELLRSRIEELNRRLASLQSGHRKK